MYGRHFLRAANSGASSGGGFKVTPEMLNSLLAGIGQTVQKGGPVVSQVTGQIADGVAKGVTQPSKAGGLLSTGLNLLKTVAPMALSFIPGGGAVSGIAKALLSTLNDDEWFSKHTGNGAAFNQFLKDELRNGIDADIALTEPNALNTTKTIPVEVRAGFASILTTVNHFQSKLWGDFMPQVIADVRRITNNVLVDDTQKYSEAFYYATCLVALYYTLRKYLEIAASQPLNIPMLTAGMTIIAPANLNLLRGIADGLEQYITATIKLPYALTAYLRWRFGTAFLSDNTGKPALILYDFNVGGMDEMEGYLDTSRFFGNLPLSTISSIIEYYQGAYVACGRAGSDIKLTYDSHDRKMDVEKAHYDEKEFNLRCNFDLSDSAVGEVAGFNVSQALMREGKEIVMDSRLDMNAAIQAVTISSQPAIVSADGSKFETSSDYTLFPVSDIRFGYYMTHTMLGVANPALAKMFGSGAGWRLVSYAESQSFLYEVSANMLNVIEISGEFRLANSLYSDHAVAGKYLVPGDELLWGKALVLPSLIASAQFHNRYYTGFGVRIRTASQAANQYSAFMVGQTLLSYDTAYVAKESLEAIQRSAARNLVRSDYKRKDVAAAKEEVAEGVKDLLSGDAVNVNKI